MSKRARSSSPPSSSASSSLSPASEPTKLRRSNSPLVSSPAASTNSTLVCTLPPTCTHRPTALASSAELESHYATYHTHVCEELGCGCVFPEERFLELHQTECHDSLASIRQSRGEKIFQCFLPPNICPRTFSTPRTRRLHLIDAHGYPKEYFFAVTNKGVGGLVRKWGAGVGLVRGTWKPREGDKKKTESSSSSDEDDSDEESEEDAMSIQQSPTIAFPPTKSSEDSTMDALTTQLRTASLGMVPSSIRFGRGAARSRGRGSGVSYAPTSPTSVGVMKGGGGRGRGWKEDNAPQDRRGGGGDGDGVGRVWIPERELRRPNNPADQEHSRGRGGSDGGRDRGGGLNFGSGRGFRAPVIGAFGGGGGGFIGIPEMELQRPDPSATRR